MQNINDALKERVLVLDGAMGTMIQLHGFAGCNDALVLTQPHIIEDIHKQYIEAGADIIETNTFNANAISLKEYGLEDKVYQINFAAAELARKVAGYNHYVAGSIGPTSISLSMPQCKVSFDELCNTYQVQARGLIDGGVDVILIETIFDTLNAKAAILAVRQVSPSIPIMISATLSENGRLLSGQSINAFIDSISHANPISIGLNCGFGVEQMLPFIDELQGSPFAVSLHANAGLPDELGRYRQDAQTMSFTLKRLLSTQKLNIVGGCCGTTPKHIKAIAQVAHNAKPRTICSASNSNRLALSGLESLPHKDFLKIGERCNVAGSSNFLKMIQQGDIDKAIDTAASQIESGADVLDINMDDGLLNAAQEMTRFVIQLGLDVRTAKVPLMIDSSDFDVICEALKHIQGRAIVNSISLKEGEQTFLKRARMVRELGAAVVVMAFDEQGQADTFERRIDICRRSYELLTQKAGFKGNEIVFDPNVLAIGTGIAQHANYAIDFIRATQWITQNLPGAKVSGGISNLSFAFRGHNELRKMMHALFLSHARKHGLSMAIMNPSAPTEPTDSMDKGMLSAIEDLLLNKSDDATDQLMKLAALRQTNTISQNSSPQVKSVSPTIQELILRGIDSNIEELLKQELQKLGSAMAVINGPLMTAMDTVGIEFGAGRIFLPQVVKAAAVMNKAVEFLTPYITNNSAATTSRPKMVLATVKGDVHDIGKNIVATVMRCSGFEVIDLGVMVEAKTIVETAIANNAALIGLSGLITPSLNEMCNVAKLLQERGSKIPLFVGGATTSETHTAVKIAPLYDGLVIRTADAASLPPKALRISELENEIRASQETLRQEFQNNETKISIQEARLHNEAVENAARTPNCIGTFNYEPTLSELTPLINWRALLGEWSITPNTPEGTLLIDDAKKHLEALKFTAKCRVILCKALRSAPEEIQLPEFSLHTPRSLKPNPITGKCPALADFISKKDDHIGLFATCIHSDFTGQDEYTSTMNQILCHRLAEAATKWLHMKVQKELWGINETCGIRPAIGYTCLPEHNLIFSLDKALRLSELGITLTENGGMYPDASTCGLIIGHPQAHYF